MGLPFLLFRVNPCLPLIFKFTRNMRRRLCVDGLAITASNKVDEEAVEEVGHVVLLLSCSAFAKTFDEEDCLQYP